MYYEITQDGAGFLPSETARMDVDGLYIRSLALAYIFTGASGILLINSSPALSALSILKQMPLLGTPHSLHIIQRHEEETDAAESVKRRCARDLPSLQITHESTAATSLLMETNATVITDGNQISQAEFSIITPPEREKRMAINSLNNLFPPLMLHDVHVDLQFNGEVYLEMPVLQLTQQKMKVLARRQARPEPYMTALKHGLCMGLFDLRPAFAQSPSPLTHTT